MHPGAVKYREDYSEQPLTAVNREVCARSSRVSCCKALWYLRASDFGS